MASSDPAESQPNETIQFGDTVLLLAVRHDGTYLLDYSMDPDEVLTFLDAIRSSILEQMRTVAAEITQVPGTCDVGTRFSLSDLPADLVIAHPGLNWVDPCPNPVACTAAIRVPGSWRLCLDHGTPIIEALERDRRC
jgi:hypothetical protein